jgi:PIN domain nuclease of toxin-antitoxin system
VRLLLDTHALLWAIGDPERLRDAARTALWDAGNEVRVSVASIWEIGIKRGLGKLTAPDDLGPHLEAANFEPLLISLEHARAAGLLPPHHRDPFDRMLIAQAQLESLTIVTRDARFVPYGVQLLEA